MLISQKIQYFWMVFLKTHEYLTNGRSRSILYQGLLILDYVDCLFVFFLFFLHKNSEEKPNNKERIWWSFETQYWHLTKIQDYVVFTVMSMCSFLSVVAVLLCLCFLLCSLHFNSYHFYDSLGWQHIFFVFIYDLIYLIVSCSVRILSKSQVVVHIHLDFVLLLLLFNPLINPSNKMFFPKFSMVDDGQLSVLWCEWEC